jgi:hypothetical protein
MKTKCEVVANIADKIEAVFDHEKHIPPQVKRKMAELAADEAYAYPGGRNNENENRENENYKR